MRKLRIAGGVAGWVLGGMLASATAEAAAPGTPGTGTETGVAVSAHSFAIGLRAYVDKDFPGAREVFLALAALGDGPSMYNLGAMAFRGEATEKSAGAAVGWWRAAAEAGYGTGIGLADKYEPRLDAAGQRERAAILARYGRENLQRTVLPEGGERSCGGQVEPSRVKGEIAEPDYPDFTGVTWNEAMVVISVRIDTLGNPHDPRVLFAVPVEGGLADEFIRESSNALLRTKFVPARAGDRAVPSTFAIRFHYRIGDNTEALRGSQEYRRILALADAGNAEASFLVGTIRRAGSRAGNDQAEAEATALILSAAQAGVPEAQVRVAADLMKGGEACPQNDRAMIWLRAAARSGLPEARTALARALLAGAEPPLGEIEQLLKIGTREHLPRHVQRELIAIWLASPHERLRNTAAALALARRYFPGDLGSLLDLELSAAVELASGRTASAVRLQQRAVDKARSKGYDTYPLQQRLNSYVAGTPWYGDLLRSLEPAPATPAGTP